MKLTKNQRWVLDYIGNCGHAPPKCQVRTLLFLQEQGLIVGWRTDCYQTHKGGAILRGETTWPGKAA